MMRIEKRKLSDLIEADYNPRKKLIPTDAEYQKISRSIDEFGYVDPIIINADNTIIGGNQRKTVLADKGWDEVNVVVLNIPKEQEKALNIALNKITGQWDMEKLKNILQELDSSSIDTTLTGFDINEIEDLMLQFHQDDPVEDDDFDVDEAYKEIVEPKTNVGDIWYLGNHLLICGDSTEETVIDKLLNGEKTQLIVTDPPYNVDYHGIAGSIANDNMTDSAFYEFLLSAFQNMYRSAEPGAAIYVFHADSEGLNFRRAFHDAGFLTKQCIIWVKNSLVLGRQDYQWRHEPILYGWKDGAAHYFVDDRAQTTVIDDGGVPNFKRMKKEELLNFIEETYSKMDKTPQTIIYCDKPSRSEEHPTMKPPSLLGKLISNSSKSGWIVADFFGGSGSTMIACERLGRKARLIEYDPKYCDVIVQRYVKMTGDRSCFCITTNGGKFTYADVFSDE